MKPLFKKTIYSSLSVTLSLLALSGCGSDNSVGSGSVSTFSGTLTSLHTQMLGLVKYHQRLTGLTQLQSGSANTVSCSTAGNPPTIVSGSVNGDGTFNVDLSSVLGQALTCTILDSGNSVLATFLYQNSTQKSFGGSAQKLDTVALSDSTDVGSVTMAGGQATVDAHALGISTSGVTLAAQDAFDPTGNWAMSSVDFTLPPGYVNPCAPGDNTCHGPTAGDTIYIKRVVGKTFTPDGACQAAADAGTFTSSDTCTGTTGSDDSYVFSIWMNQNTFKACGDNTKGALGFKEAQAKAYGHLDLSTDTTTIHDAFNYSTSVSVNNVTHNITGGWKDDHATSNWELNSCSGVSSGGQNAWMCTDDSNHFSLSLGGGCTDSNGNPVQPDDWSHVNWGAASGCVTSTTTFDIYTVTGNTCNVPYTPSVGSPQTLSCGGTYGAFTGTYGDPPVSYNGSVTPTTLLAQGGLCNSLNPANGQQRLQQLMCYANYFFNNSNNYGNTACVRQIRTDWSATDDTGFVLKDGPGRPLNMALTERVTYLSAEVATFTQYEDDFRGLQVTGQNGTSWLNCHTKNKNTITVTKKDDTHLIVKFVQETNLQDTKAACQAAAADATQAQKLGIGSMRMMFLLTKQ
jgi:hypothetical protein